MNKPLICLDARMINASGIGTYLRGLIESLQVRPDLPIAFSLLGDPATLPATPWPARRVKAPIYSIREQWEIPWAFRQTRAAILHAPHYNMPILAASRTIVSVMDLIHLKFPQFWPSLTARVYARLFFHRIVPRARHILTISENTKKDLMDMLSIPADHITVAYPAVWHERFQNIPPEALKAFEKLGLPQEYLLYVGNLKEFKNVERLLEAYRRFKESRSDAPLLVMVGRNFIPGFERRMQEVGVRWMGDVSRELLPVLYKHALAFLYPSLYEGFGLPPLEAMAAGTPVLSSDRASLPEVVGAAALLVNPENTVEIISGIERLVDDGGLRKNLSAKGLQQATRFSWGATASKTIEVYQTYS